ncbi:MAG: alpha/beta hydrolase [Alphaproteobacteria bacterium]|nr:alpha/beta hydrolase [Alphaproteobacteria bacterium]
MQTGKFELAGYRRFSAPADPTVSIYIEGDGLAFLSESVVSRDPTPRDPVSLRLAARDPSPNVAYLARPCQYVDAPSRANCQYTYWTKARFAPEVVRETNLAVDAIKKNAGAQSVRLYGYSGGGVLAALVAGVRSDVTSLVTFGAPLDHVTWTRVKRFTPLSESMTPMTDVRDLARIPQVHYLGEDDDVVPPIAVTSFVEAVRAAGGNARFVEVPDVGHRCCWQQRWPALGPIEGHRS